MNINNYPEPLLLFISNLEVLLARRKPKKLESSIIILERRKEKNKHAISQSVLSSSSSRCSHLRSLSSHSSRSGGDIASRTSERANQGRRKKIKDKGRVQRWRRRRRCKSRKQAWRALLPLYAFIPSCFSRDISESGATR